MLLSKGSMGKPLKKKHKKHKKLKQNTKEVSLTVTPSVGESVLETTKLKANVNWFQKYRKHLAYIAWVQALIAMVGSLFFSEVMKLPPCVLCWYQRIAMYPLVFVLAIGIILEDKRMKLYALPLSITGLCISIYHNLLYYNIIPEAIIPCSSGVSCTTKQIEWLGFITIPLLALVAFSVITISLLLHKKEEDHESTT